LLLFQSFNSRRQGGMYLFDHIQFVSIFTNDLDDAPNIRRRRTKSPPE